MENIITVWKSEKIPRQTHLTQFLCDCAIVKRILHSRPHSCIFIQCHQTFNFIFEWCKYHIFYIITLFIKYILPFETNEVSNDWTGLHGLFFFLLFYFTVHSKLLFMVVNRKEALRDPDKYDRLQAFAKENNIFLE